MRIRSRTATILHAMFHSSVRSASLALRVMAALIVAVASPHEVLAQESPAQQWSHLEHSHWIADGKSDAPRVVYVFTDPNCPYCNKFWSEARPWVHAGRVQLRHVIVGVLTATSPAKAAALLASKNPSWTFDAYERRNAASVTQAVAQGHPHALDDPSLRALSPVPPELEAALAGNEQLMTSLGLRATPGFAWHDADGRLQILLGLPQGSELEKMLGPR